ALVATRGLGVLWATHLIDEIATTDRIVLLHRGQVLFAGSVPQMLEKTGETDLRAAFRKMTGTEELEAA
ncbi:MAG TPA: ABC transporter ATP-binding protein, partial [Hyphomicrobiaceae bacterium]|nr:ABC transporter ATP-binding protein [Hyphomicrobiaceae bacterium]